jgi:hypothetical protein
MSPNDLGKTFLVDECQKININTILKAVKLKLKDALIQSELGIQGITVELITSNTGFGGVRYWFKCPQCKRRVGTLFTHAISQNLGCRSCLGLEYRKCRYKGMVENLIG